jgi:hypothetical protein
LLAEAIGRQHEPHLTAAPFDPSFNRKDPPELGDLFDEDESPTAITHDPSVFAVFSSV